jgi:hypothetical protein
MSNIIAIPYGSPSNLKLAEPKKVGSSHEAFTLHPNNKAAQIRYLISKGYTVKATHKVMVEHYGSFRYQHVYNNSKRQLKKS